MFLGYRMKKRSMPAYEKVVVPELIGYRSVSKEQPLPVSAAKRHIRSALRTAACIVLAFTLIGLVVSENSDDASIQGAGAKNSFTLIAYAASDAGNPSDENSYTLSSKMIDHSTGITIQPNTRITLPVRKNYQVNPGSEEGKFDINYSVFSFHSGFQFSGGTIDSITMTTENGKFVAYDYSRVMPIYQKYAKVYPQSVQSDNGGIFVVCVISDEKYTDEEREVIKTYKKTGKTVTFPPAGFTSYWNYTPDENGKVSDAIKITIKFIDGSSQESVMSISENENGVITAELQ